MENRQTDNGTVGASWPKKKKKNMDACNTIFWAGSHLSYLRPHQKNYTVVMCQLVLMIYMAVKHVFGAPGKNKQTNKVYTVEMSSF